MNTRTSHSEFSPTVNVELFAYPAQMDAYKAALEEEMETSVRVEPGVRMISRPALKVFKDKTQNMVKSLRLIEAELRLHELKSH